MIKNKFKEWLPVDLKRVMYTALISFEWRPYIFIYNIITKIIYRPNNKFI